MSARHPRRDLAGVVRTRLLHALNTLDVRRKTHHFIHIPKNGGRSLREALALRRVALERPLHSRYRDFDVRSDVRYFCTVRNPWSRTVSRYLFTKLNARDWRDDDPRKQYIGSVSFANYVRDRREFSIPGEPHRPWPLSLWIDQLEWIEDDDGEVAGDCLRLESIEEDVSAYFGRRIEVPHRRAVRTGSHDYRSFYTPESVRIVADVYAADIEYFGFDFDGPATRRTFTTA